MGGGIRCLFSRPGCELSLPEAERERVVHGGVKGGSGSHYEGPGRGKRWWGGGGYISVAERGGAAPRQGSRDQPTHLDELVDDDV